jgi:ABC-type transport system substrate-binding protein
MSESNYWNRLGQRRMSRRTVLGASAKAGVGAAGLALVGCGDDDDDDDAVSQAPSTPSDQADDQATDQAADSADDQATPADDADDDEAVSAGPGEPQYGGTMRTFDFTDLLSFDQFLTFGYQAFLHGHMTYPKLTKLKVGPDQPTNKFDPELWLADSVEQPDELTNIFSLNPDAKWEDIDPTNGRALTSEDVLYTFGEPYQAFPNRAIVLPHLESVTAPDAQTVEFKLIRPLAPFLLYMGHQAGPHIYPFEHATWDDSRGRAVSAAAWKWDSYDPGSKVTYTRNTDDYFRKPYPYFDKVEILFTSDPSAIDAALRTGELDMGWSAFFPMFRGNVAALKADFPDANWEEFPQVEAGGVTTDLGAEPFSDARVRQAISNAMDRTAMLEVAQSQPPAGAWMSALPPMGFWWRDPSNADDAEFHKFFKRDPARARQLIDAALGPDGVPDQVMNTNQGYGPLFVEMSQVLQANYGDIGVDVELNIQTQAEYYSSTFIGEHTGSMGHNRMVGTTEPDEPFSFIYRGDSPRSGIPNGEEMDSDPILQDFLSKQRQETDRDARKEIIDDFQMYLAEQMYLIPVVAPAATLFARPGIEDVYWTSTFAPAPQIEKAWFSDL